METAKTVSVVMCTYNGARYLKKQMDSLLAQTYAANEIIVQDDGSTDETWALLEEYARRFDQIHIFRNEGPHGINGNFFSAMRRAQCDYIAISDQDDIWEPHKLELQMKAIGDHLLCSGFSVPFSTEGFPVTADRRRPNFHLLRLAYLAELPGHTFLMRKELPTYIAHGDDCPNYYDWQLQIVAAAAESIVFVDEVLVHFRRHADAATASIPVNNRLLSGTTWHYIRTTLFHHRILQQHIRARMERVDNLLKPLPFRTSSAALCRRMVKLQRRRDLWTFVRRTYFFVRHRDKLFHVAERRPLLAVLRALYFPFSCGYYYRDVLKKPHSTHK